MLSTGEYGPERTRRSPPPNGLGRGVSVPAAGGAPKRSEANRECLLKGSECNISRAIAKVVETGSTSPSVAAAAVRRVLPRANPPEVAIILPTLNEARNLRTTLESIPLEEFRANGWAVHPVVIDGGSTDGTVAVAQDLGLPVLSQVSRGKGGAIREALQYAQSEGMRFAVVMDADSTYPGVAIRSLLALLDSGSDLVVGVRQNFRKPKGLKEFVHRIGNAALTYVASALGRELILDLCSGLWGVDLTTWSDRGLRSTGFEIESELFLKTLLQGYSVAQIPIPYRARAEGAKLRTVRDGSRILLSIVSAMRFRGVLGSSARPPEENLLRSVLAVCFIQGSGRLVVLADAKRIEDAQHLSDSLVASGIQTEVELITAPGATGSSDLLGSMVRTSNSHHAPVVALTDRTGATPKREARIVLLPNTQRIIGLGLDPVDGGRPANRRMMAFDRSGATTDGFSIISTRPAEHPVGSFRSLGTALDHSAARSQMMFLGANQIGLSLSLMRVRGQSEDLAPGPDPQARAGGK